MLEKFLDLKNIIIYNKELKNPKGTFDLMTLDLLEPTKIKSFPLRRGGYCIAYLPHFEQVKEFCKYIKSKSLFVDRILETVEKEYGLNKKKEVKHTAYLVFCRKI